MPRGKPSDGSKNPGGRPRKHWHNAPVEVVEKKVFELASYSLAAREIASFLGFTEDNLYKTYSSALQRGHDECNASLRKMQYESAKNGNVTMQIWLGKQRLKQVDRQEHSGPDGKAIPISYEAAQSALMALISAKQTDKTESVQ